MEKKHSLADILRPDSIRAGFIPNVDHIKEIKEETKAQECPIGFHLFVNQVMIGSPSDIAGIQKNDSIISIDGKPILGGSIVSVLREKQGGQLRFCILRDGHKLNVTINPRWEAPTIRGCIGIDFESTSNQCESHIGETRTLVTLGPKEKISSILYESGNLSSEYLQPILSITVSGKNADGKEVSMDLLRRFNNRGTKIYFNQDMSQSGLNAQVMKPRNGSLVSANAIFLRDIGSPGLPHAVLHELRHDSQNTMKTFDRLGQLGYIDVTKRVADGAISNEVFTESSINRLVKIVEYLLPNEDLADIIKPLRKKMNEGVNSIRFMEQQLNQIKEGYVPIGRNTRHQYQSALMELIGAAAYDTTASLFPEQPVVSSNTFHKAYRTALSFFSKRTEPENISWVREQLKRASVSINGTSVDDSLAEPTARAIYRDLFTEFNHQKHESDFVWELARMSADATSIELPLNYTGGEDRVRIRFPIQRGDTNKFEITMTGVKNAISSSKSDTKTDNFILRKQIEAAQQALEQTEVITGVTVLDFFRLPTLIIERDAEYGALVGLRAIKNETGLDLLVGHSKHGDETNFGEKLANKPKITFTKKTLRNQVQSLESIAAYMESIGVSNDCLHVIKKRRSAKHPK